MLADLLMTIDAVLLGAVLATDREAWDFLGVVAQFLAFGVLFFGALFVVAGGLGYAAGLVLGAPG
jgi:hypothetical protein